MNIALIGYGVENQEFLAYLETFGHQITICDQNESLQVPSHIPTQLGYDYLRDLDRFDQIVRTSGMHPNTILEQNPTVGPKITTAINEFMRVCPTRNIIGVTGTKGKGTTSTLISLMLRQAGKTVHLGGNIGVSPFTFGTINPDDWVVLELSSFQLIDLKTSPHIAVCLMVVPEHLNWHADMAEYVQAKAQLFEHQSAEDLSIFYAKNEESQDIASHGAGQMIPYYEEPGVFVENGEIKLAGGHFHSNIICRTDEVKLLGEHNLQNICAAATTVLQIVPDFEAIRAVATQFAGLPHRLEKLQSSDGLTYFNDSFAATPDAAMAALDALPGMKVMICGGVDRGLALTNFASSVAAHTHSIRSLLLIGESAERFSQELEQAGFTNYEIIGTVPMPDIIQRARSVAQPGDAIVLSPGFASFDMFNNFEDRGNQFKAAVQEQS